MNNAYKISLGILALAFIGLTLYVIIKDAKEEITNWSTK